MALETPPTSSEIMEALAKAEVEAFAWATGQRSTINAMFGAEHYYAEPSASGNSTINSPDRQLSLLRVAEADAAETRAARERLLNLRALAGLTPEGADPLHVESVLVARHGLPG